jgi:hypothetical protein
MSIWIECEYCGIAHLAERRSAKYCSDSCKTMACRRRKIIAEKERRRIKHQIALLDLAQAQADELNRQAEVERKERARILDEERIADRKKKEEQRAASEQKREMEKKKSDEWFRIIEQLLPVVINKLFENSSKGSNGDQNYERDNH